MTKIMLRVLLPATLLIVFAATQEAAPAHGATASQKSGGAAQAASVVRTFYNDHFARRQCCFDEAGLKRRRQWFEPSLYNALLREVRKPAPADEAPYFNGDPFTDSQEGPADFSVGHASAGGGRATVSVLLRWADKGKTVERRTLRIELTRTRGVWRIDDIRYPDGQSLRGQLKQSG
ncbi:MAG TPA: hypothetical protein VF240_08220 [Pyrinomonadaceae bacterium]